MLRAETEYKDELAKETWAQILMYGPSVMSGHLAGEVDNLPLDVFPEMAALREYLSPLGARPSLLYTPATDETRLRWLDESVRPAVSQLLRGPRRAEVIAWLESFADIE